MEALQVYSTSSETLPKPSPPSKVSNLDCARSPLVSVSTTPSVIEVPTLSENGNPGTHSILTPTAIAIEPSLSPITESLPEVFVFQEFHVSPSMAIDGGVKLVWTQKIKPRLSATLLYSIPTGTCILEFMMVGKKRTALKPTVLVTCGDAATKKSAEKLVKRQVWLQDLLRKNGIEFVALVTKTAFMV